MEQFAGPHFQAMGSAFSRFCSRAVFAVPVALVLGACSSGDLQDRRKIADVVIEYGGEPQKFNIGQTIYAEGLLSVGKDQRFALFMKLEQDGHEFWRCAVLSEIHLADRLMLPSDTPNSQQDRAYAVFGKIVGARTAFGSEDSRSGRTRCAAEVAVTDIAQTRFF